MPHMRLAGYAPGPGLASLPVWAFYLHPVPLAFAPGTLADLIRTGLRTVALIGLPQIDAFTRSAAVQGGGILTCHQMKIEQEHDVPNRAFDAAKMAVRLTMARVGIRRVKAERQRPVLARYRTRTAGQRQSEFFAQLVLQRLEFRHRIQHGLGVGPEMQAPRGKAAVQGQEQVGQSLLDHGEIACPHGGQIRTGKVDQPLQALPRGTDGFGYAPHGVKPYATVSPNASAFSLYERASLRRMTVQKKLSLLNYSRSLSVFLTTHMVALRLGLTPDAVRWHERNGHLQSIKVQRSPTSYQRLYFEENVEAFRQKREADALARQTQDDAIEKVVVP